jgi:chromate transporter
MAIHIGHEPSGCKGLITAGFFFIIMEIIILGIFAWLYKE